ncbi:hypothetical protein OIO90_000857 [Microbotryomycetes sp. JL221]|nr:hypothetical protein OIO90_000857 [Microbotryomycetes sp. JL221]
MVQNTSLHFVQVPDGEPKPGVDMKRVEEEFDADNAKLAGGLLIKTKAISLDPYMRGRMRDASVKSYSPPYELNKPMTAFALGTVVRSEHEQFKEGHLVTGVWSMSEYAVVPGAYVELLRLRSIPDEAKHLPAPTLLGALGMPGQTAYWSYYNIGRPKKGETIFVSAAAGAVGQIVCQLAKRDGLKVVGSAGDDQKVAFLNDLGVDVAFNYKTESTDEYLKSNPPDIYYDNVGGETLDTVFKHINKYGRIVACGAVSQYNKKADERYGLKNTMSIVAMQLTFQGFIMDGDKDREPFFKEMPKLVAEGTIKTREHVTKGLDNGEAFVDMLAGKAQGKAVISLE